MSFIKTANVSLFSNYICLLSNRDHMICRFVLLCFVGDAGGWTQGFALARHDLLLEPLP
jgi:hypothetical protein